MDIGYARVSTKDQSLDLQVDALRRAGCAKVYHEHINMLGRYSFSLPEAVAKGELRPLRDPVEG